jgi:hypothetical protein
MPFDPNNPESWIQYRDGTNDSGTTTESSNFRESYVNQVSFGDPGYETYDAWSSYKDETGILIGPVATGELAADPEVMIVHSRYTQKKVKFKGSKIGSAPAIPHPNSVASGEVLLSVTDAVVTAGAPRIAQDGQTLAYTVSGDYSYVVSGTGFMGSYPIVTAHLPWTGIVTPQTTLPVTVFSRTITGDRGQENVPPLVNQGPDPTGPGSTVTVPGRDGGPGGGSAPPP